MEENKYKEYADQCIDNIIDALGQIKAHKITILTGDNASGKSLVRKQVWEAIERDTGKRVITADSSMERRTGLHSELGGGGVFVRDTAWSATSENSIHFIKCVLQATERYVVIDEPEIGCSLSLQASIGEYLNKVLPEVLGKNYGIMIITHSKEIVKRLTCADTFINLQKRTKDEWLNMEPEVIDLDEFLAKSSALFKGLQKALHKVEE